MGVMNIMMWAALSVLVAYNGNAELATVSVVLLTIAVAADEKRRGACAINARTSPAVPAG